MGKFSKITNEEVILDEQKIVKEVNKEEPLPIDVPVEENGFDVHVLHARLRKRKAPSTDAEIAGMITDKGIYHIVEEHYGWGRLEDGSWIMLQYAKRLN